MAKKATKPAEYRRFEDLTKSLLEVPKPELDKQLKRYEAKKKEKQARRAEKRKDG